MQVGLKFSAVAKHSTSHREKEYEGNGGQVNAAVREHDGKRFSRGKQPEPLAMAQRVVLLFLDRGEIPWKAGEATVGRHNGSPAVFFDILGWEWPALSKAFEHWSISRDKGEGALG
jgi:hypothetical protein